MTLSNPNDPNRSVSINIPYPVTLADLDVPEYFILPGYVSRAIMALPHKGEGIWFRNAVQGHLLLSLDPFARNAEVWGFIQCERYNKATTAASWSAVGLAVRKYARPDQKAVKVAMAPILHELGLMNGVRPLTDFERKFFYVYTLPDPSC